MFCFFLIQFPSCRIEVARRSFILQPWLQSHYSFLFSLCGRAGNQLTKGCWIGNWQLSNWGEGKPVWREQTKNSIANSDNVKTNQELRESEAVLKILSSILSFFHFTPLWFITNHVQMNLSQGSFLFMTKIM